MEEKKKRELTIKQNMFIDKVLETGNATEAAAQVYNCNNRNTAGNIGCDNLKKPNIKEELEHRIEIAKKQIFVLATTAEKEEVRLRASQDIVDRGEGKATQKVEGELKGNFTIGRADAPTD